MQSLNHQFQTWTYPISDQIVAAYTLRCMFPDNKKLLRFATTFHKCFKVHPLENSKWINERTQLRFLKSIPSFIPKLLWVPDGFFWRAAGQCFGVGRRPTNETFLAPKVNQTAHKLHPSAPPKPVWPKRGSAQELRLTGNFIFSARKPRTSAKKAPECCCGSLIFFLSQSWSRFKRRISHVPNLMRELNACEVRRLNQLNSTV